MDIHGNFRNNINYFGPFAVIGAISAGISIIGGIKKMREGNSRADQAVEDAEAAQAELARLRTQFENLDTSNPYLNLENMYEDMTVNQQEAEFKKQQQIQSQANILDQLRSGAGASGIAALAQSLANQGSLDAQKTAASIGAQEQANQLKKAEEASKIQSLEREGEVISRQAEASKLSGLMGLSAAELAAARGEAAAAQEQKWAGIGDITGGVLNFATMGFKPNVPQQQVI